MLILGFVKKERGRIRRYVLEDLFVGLVSSTSKNRI